MLEHLKGVYLIAVRNDNCIEYIGKAEIVEMYVNDGAVYSSQYSSQIFGHINRTASYCKSFKALSFLLF